MAKKNQELNKRNSIDRVNNIFHDLELNILYSPPNMRKLLKDKYNDSISLKTVRELLNKIIEAQDKGMQYKIENKLRKLIIRKTSNKGKLYELIEEIKSL